MRRFPSILALVILSVAFGIAQNVRTVKALAGDTVEKLAVRYGADPAEVAKQNGLLPSSVLVAGREIDIPAKYMSCSMALSDSPTVRGFKLGMTKSDVSARFGRSVGEDGIKSDDWGFWAAGRGLKGFDGVSYVKLFFYDGKLADLEVHYDTSIDWNSMQEFASSVGQSLNLPNGAWEIGVTDARMKCSDFVVKLGGPFVPVLKLTDAAALEKKISDEENKSAEKKRLFKP